MPHFSDRAAGRLPFTKCRDLLTTPDKTKRKVVSESPPAPRSAATSSRETSYVPRSILPQAAAKLSDRVMPRRRKRRACFLRRRSISLLTPLLFNCAGTVSELHLFQRLGLLLERKQIPQVVVNVRIRRKAMEPLEATRLPWAHPPERRRASSALHMQGCSASWCIGTNTGLRFGRRLVSRNTPRDFGSLSARSALILKHTRTGSGITNGDCVSQLFSDPARDLTGSVFMVQ